MTAIAYVTSCFRKHFIVAVVLSLFIYGAFYRYLITKTWKSSISSTQKPELLTRQVSFADSWNVRLSNVLSSFAGVNVVSDLFGARSKFETVVAIGGGLTSRSIVNLTTSNAVAKFQFFHTFLPTFCSTASPGYAYRFYLAFDVNDPVFTSSELASGFHKTFAAEVQQLCERSRGIRTSLHLVQCDHDRRPAWAQNDAMLEAYLDDVDYFFRINDDTRLKTGNWTERFIETLNRYDPPLVGVVGPNHSGGNTNILTYDFVHRTHVDVFGFYYPRLFTDWYADGWITRVYQPNRTTKISDIRLDHTMGLGQRYGVRGLKPGQNQKTQIATDKVTLDRYIAAVRLHNESGILSKKSDGRRIISMSLYGHVPRYVWGVIRNAQLVPVHFPDWRLRVYVPSDEATANETTVLTRVIGKLRRLGVDVHPVSNSTLPPRDWRLLAADDETVDYFVIRDADGRLNDRDASAVMEWIGAVERSADEDVFPVHRMFDHRLQTNKRIVDGLWGGRPSVLRRTLKGRLTEVYVGSLARTVSSSDNSSIRPSALESVLEPFLLTTDSVFCHRDVSEPCAVNATIVNADDVTSCRPFPVSRLNAEYVGLKFDEHQERTDNLRCNKTSTLTSTSTKMTTTTTTTVSSIIVTPKKLPASKSESTLKFSRHVTEVAGKNTT